MIKLTTKLLRKPVDLQNWIKRLVVRLEVAHRDAKKLPREKEISQIPRYHGQAPERSST